MATAVELLANPDFLGTKSDIAKQAGVSPRTFYRWLRNPEFIKLVNRQVLQYADAELAIAWKALCRKIKSGDMAAIRLYFELRERGMQIKKELDTESKNTSKLYDILGADDETNYDALTEAETGDEMGTYADVPK